MRIAARLSDQVAAIAVFLALTACQSGSLAPSASSWAVGPQGVGLPEADQHICTSPSRPQRITRQWSDFASSRASPPTKPDRVYGGYGGLIAAAGDGTLYVLSYNGIDVFAPGATTPTRQIIVPTLARRCHLISGGSSAINGLAADRNGYLFVALVTYTGAPKGGDESPQFRWPCDGVLIYAPGASGKAQPVQTIRQNTTPVGIAVDDEDNVYFADRDSVREFLTQSLDPHRARVFQSQYTGNVRAVATGHNGDLFIASTDASYKSGGIERYARSAKGNGPPTNTIVLPAGVQLLPALAAKASVLYVDDNYDGVDSTKRMRTAAKAHFIRFLPRMFRR